MPNTDKHKKPISITLSSQIQRSILALLTRSTNHRELLNNLVNFMKRHSNCEAVGVRLLNEHNEIPYEASNGFSNQFLLSESQLSLDCENCLCTRTIQGKFNHQEKKQTTPRGSFCTGDLGCFFIPSHKRKKNQIYRKACLKAGFRSTAIIPLRYKRQTLGTIHIADKRPDAISHDFVSLLENLAPLITDSLHKFKVETEVKHNYDIQQVTNSLLRLSITDASLETIFKKALTEILSIPWLAFQATGSIFLVDHENNTLVMQACQGIDPRLRKKCERVPFGKCLCGRAAQTKKPIFTNCLSVDHEFNHRNIQPHGHYCVPIIDQNRTLGVINIYVKEGHKKQKNELDFLNAIANTLASIIQKKDAANKLARSNRALNALSSCNHTLIHADNETSLLNEICNIIVKIGGYKLAWVAKPEQDQYHSVTSIAQAGVGVDKKYIDQAKISWSKSKARGKGIIGTSIRTKKIQIGKDFLTEKNLAPWKKNAIQLGYRSAISLPLLSNGHFYGALAIYASEPNAFDRDEIKLLTELANDLAFGIYTLRMRNAHQLAEKALKRSNELLEKTFSTTHFMLANLATDFTFIRVNAAYTNAKGYADPDFFVGKNYFSLFPHSTKKEIFQQVLATGKPYSAYAQAFVHNKNGQKEIVYWDWSLQPIIDSSGQIRSLLLSAVDVTDRIQAEEKLLESYKHLGIINRQISILLDLNKQSGGGNVSEIIHYVINSTQNLSQATLVSLYRYNEQEKTLSLVSSSNNTNDMKKTINVKKYPFLMPVVSDNRRIQGIFQENTSVRICKNQQLKYFLFLPLSANKKVKGVLFLGFDKKDCLTTQELEFYEAFINQASYVFQDLDIL